ncbi:MAG: MauE/DoxX family redox-associated membrane protein [Actinomycetota bacterium]
MTNWGASAAVVLGLVFLWSGVAKIASREAWQVAGTPFSTGKDTADRVVRMILPSLEVAVGALLSLRVVPIPVAIVAAVMLVAFTAALVRVLVTGQRPPCMCFGAVRAKPVSWASVVRNAALIALACVVIAGA